MYSFNWKLPEWAGPIPIQKHLIRSLLKRSLGSFVKSDFPLDTVDLEVTKGQLSLKELDIDSEKINDLLGGAPIQVISGTIESINVKAPWPGLFTDPFQIHIDGLKIRVKLGANNRPKPEESLQSILEASTISITNDFMSELQEFPESEENLPPQEPDVSNAVGNWIDKLVARLKLTLGSIQIEVVSKTGPDLTFSMESAELFEDSSTPESVRKLPSFSRKVIFKCISLALDGGKTPILSTTGSFSLDIKNVVGLDSTCQLSVQAKLGQIQVAVSPRQVEELDRFFQELTSIPGSDQSSRESGSLDWSLDLTIESILIKFIYLNTSQNLFKPRRNLSHLCIDISQLKIQAKNASPSNIPFYTHDRGFSQRVIVDIGVNQLEVKEWLSSSQYPPSQIPEGAKSFARDCYLPIILFDPGLPNSSLLLETLPLIGHRGESLGTLGVDLFHGLPTFWASPHNLNPQLSALQICLTIAETCDVKLTTSPVWLRVDPRMVDRLEGFLVVLKNRESIPSPPPPSNMDFNEHLIMNDLDSRDSERPSAKWTVNASTEYLRILIQAPCDITGDDQDANHRFARVHSDFWVMDCLQPWAAMPGPLPCIPGHAKIGYQGLDISLLMTQSRKIYGFLGVGASQEGGVTPTLEIGHRSPTRPGLFSKRTKVPFPPVFEGFSEGEVKAADPGAQDEEMIGFKQATIDTSLFDIHCTFPRVLLNFTKEAFDKTQFLISDITSWEPRFLKDKSPEPECPSSPHDSEESISFYTARDEGAPFRGPASIYSADPRQIPPPIEKSHFSLSTLIVSMPLLEIHLDITPELGEPKIYSLVFASCQFFSTSKLHGKSQTYTYIESEELFLLDTTDSLDHRVILSPTPCHYKPSFQLTSFSKMELPFTTIKEVSAAIGLSGLDFRLPLSSEPPPLLKHLADFFSGDPKVSTVSSTLTRASVSLSLNEISLILLPPDGPWLVILIEHFGASSIIFPPDPVLHAHAGIGKAQILLSQENPEVFATLPPLTQRRHSPQRSLQTSALQFWESHQFAQIGFIDCLSIRAAIHNRDKAPQIGIDITNETVALTLCRDSLILLRQVLLSLSPEPDPEAANSEPAEDLKLGVLDQSISYNILDTLEENAYGKKESGIQRCRSEPTELEDIDFIDEFLVDDIEDSELNPPASLTHTPLARSRRRNSRKDPYYGVRCESEFEKSEQEGDIVRVLDFSPPEIIDDYFSADQELHRPTGGIELENAKFRLRLLDFNLEVRLFEDQDWQLGASSSPQASPQLSPALCRVHHQVRLTRPPKPSMELVVNKLSVDFSSFLPGNEETFRLAVAANDIEVLDHIPTSNWRKFLAPMNSSSGDLPRESCSDMLRFDLTQIKTSKRLFEYRLKFSLLPIRLFVDQDALNFLTDFFIGDLQQDPLEPPEPTTPGPGNDIYFQYVEVGDIEVKLDYKPKHLSLRQLTEGNVAELAKVFQLEEAQMSLEKIHLTGVNGLNRLTDQLLSHWLQHIKSTQLPHMIGGVGPMRTLSNLSSGVADLVLLPLQQYKKDGRIVKGVTKGATSFARTTASEAVRVGASIMMGAQVILERADTLLRPSVSLPTSPHTLHPETGAVCRYSHQPENINEGIVYAYRSLSENIGAAARTVLAVPVEVTERTGTQGSTRSVIRAVPIFVLQPMIGATQAISMALLGLRNSLDPYRHERLEEKYKPGK